MSQKQTFSITRALVELKRFDDRIARAIAQGVFGVTQTGTTARAKILQAGTNRTFNNVDLAKAAINGSVQSIEALVKNRATLKSAIILSNANTKIDFLGKEISVAEAIDQKAMLPAYEKFLQQASGQLQRARADASTKNSALENQIQETVNALVSGEAAKNVTGLSALADQIGTSKRAELGVTVLAEDTVQALVDRLTELVDTIKSTLDFSLSEANARTTIEVSFDPV